MHKSGHEQILIDVVVFWDKNIVNVKKVKIQRYQDLVEQIRKNIPSSSSLFMWLAYSRLFPGIFRIRKATTEYMASLEEGRWQYCLEQIIVLSISYN